MHIQLHAEQVIQMVINDSILASLGQLLVLVEYDGTFAECFRFDEFRDDSLVEATLEVVFEFGFFFCGEILVFLVEDELFSEEFEEEEDVFVVEVNSFSEHWLHQLEINLHIFKFISQEQEPSRIFLIPITRLQIKHEFRISRLFNLNPRLHHLLHHLSQHNRVPFANTDIHERRNMVAVQLVLRAILDDVLHDLLEMLFLACQTAGFEERFVAEVGERMGKHVSGDEIVSFSLLSQFLGDDGRVEDLVKELVGVRDCGV